MLPKPSQRGRAVLFGRTARRLARRAVWLRLNDRVTDRMQARIGVGEFRSAMTGAACAGRIENELAASGGGVAGLARSMLLF